LEPVLSTERRRNTAEGRLQLAAERVHHPDDGDGNARSNQAVFDGGCPAFIPNERTHERHQETPLFRPVPS
jgi:hypothetical protein